MSSDKKTPVWWTYEPGPSRDIRQLDGAPSLSRLEHERRTRIKILKAGHQSQFDEIAIALSKARGLDPANASSCPINTRYFQVYAASRMYKALRNRGSLWMVTVCDPEDRLERGELTKLDVPAIQHRMRKRLKRSLPADAVAFAILELEWEDYSGSWLPHHHLFIAGHESWQIEPLRRFYGDRCDKRHLMRIDTANDALRRIAYTLKINVYRQTKRTRETRFPNRRLRWADFREHMVYLHGHDLTDFVFGINARLDGR